VQNSEGGSEEMMNVKGSSVRWFHLHFQQAISFCHQSQAHFHAGPMLQRKQNPTYIKKTPLKFIYQIMFSGIRHTNFYLFYLKNLLNLLHYESWRWQYIWTTINITDFFRKVCYILKLCWMSQTITHWERWRDQLPGTKKLASTFSCRYKLQNYKRKSVTLL